MKIDTSGIEETSPRIGYEVSEELDNDVNSAKFQYMTAKISQLEAETENTRNTTQLKKELADKTFKFMERFAVYAGIVFWIYTALHMQRGKPIPENVMIAFITTTLATVLGLVGFILKGLFGGNTEPTKNPPPDVPK